MGQIKYKTTNKFTPEVINEILSVAKTQGLTAKNLVESAKNQNSYLHNFFEWDNEKAGEEWRIQQARVIIGEVKIIVDSKELFAFENVSIKVDEEEPAREYKSIVEIMNTEEYRTQVIQTALSNINYWREKYSEYNELQEIFISIDKVNKKWLKKK